MTSEAISAAIIQFEELFLIHVIKIIQYGTWITYIKNMKSSLILILSSDVAYCQSLYMGFVFYVPLPIFWLYLHFLHAFYVFLQTYSD